MTRAWRPARIEPPAGAWAAPLAPAASSRWASAAEAVRLNERRAGHARVRPLRLLKAALTLDERIATASGANSKWIDQPAQRRQARWLARPHDAVLVGVGTAPRTTCRPPRARAARSRASCSTRGCAAARVGSSGRPRRRARRGRAAPPERRRVLEAVGRGGAGGARRDASAARRAHGAAGRHGSSWSRAARRCRRVPARPPRRRGGALPRAALLGGRGSRPAFGGDDPGEVRDGLRLEPVPAVPAFPWPWPPGSSCGGRGGD